MPRQLDLLSWSPPNPTARFEEPTVRSSRLAGRISKAVSVALQDAGVPREEIAHRMSAFLGEKVTTNTLNAYASEARADHAISVTRFAALVEATGDRRLLEMLAEMFGWTVMERRYLPLIELAALRDQEDRLRDRAKTLRKQAISDGVL